MGRRPKREPIERWWVVWEHEKYGEVTLVFRWQPTGQNMFRAIVESATFDLFTPQEMQDEMIEDLRAANLLLRRVDQ